MHTGFWSDKALLPAFPPAVPEGQVGKDASNVVLLCTESACRLVSFDYSGKLRVCECVVLGTEPKTLHLLVKGPTAVLPLPSSACCWNRMCEPIKLGTGS